MKLKKQYKIILGIFIIAFIGLSIFLITKKEKVTTTKKTSSADEYLAGTLDFKEGKKTDGCDAFFGVSKGVYRDATAGWPIYIAEDGCAWGKEKYLETYSAEKGNVCSVLYDYATEGYNQYSEDIVAEYNNTCNGSLASKSWPESDGGIWACNDENSSVGSFCDNYPKQLEKDFVKYYDAGVVQYYNNECQHCTSGNKNISDETINQYKAKAAYRNGPSCENIKIPRLVNGGNELLKPGKTIDGETNNCNYNLYFINGYATTLLDYFIKTNGSGEVDEKDFMQRTESLEDYKKNYDCSGNDKDFCDTVVNNQYNNFINKKVAYCNSIKNTLTNADEINNFNQYCASEDGVEKISLENYTVIFDADTGYGIKCPEVKDQNYYVESGDNKCIYHFPISNYSASSNVTIKLPDAITPEGKKMYQSTTGKEFGGWNINGSCIGDTTSGSGTNASITLSDNTDTVLSYIPCFKDRTDILSNHSTLYTDCQATFNRREKADTTSTTEYTKITETDGHTGVTNSALIRNTSYSKKIYDGSKDNTTYNNNNEFCSITCEENFNYLYPTIFETVKSGTYFDLISYPKVESTYKCTESFSYTGWKEAYNRAVNEEKEYYIRYKNAESIENAVTRWERSYEHCTSCGENCVTCETCNIYSAKIDWYSLSSNNITHSANTKYISYDDCDSGWETARKNIRINNRLPKEIDTAKTQYEEKVGKRTRLETLNHNCETTLISKSTNENTSNAFYRVEPQIDFIYQTDTTKSNNLSKAGESGSNYARETLNKNISIKDDLTNIKKDSVTELKGTTKINDDSIYGSYTDKCGTNCASDYYKTDDEKDLIVSREVNLTAVFNHSEDHKEYYVHGETIKSGDKLSSTQKKNYIRLGYVYPVDLSIHGSRNVYFLIDMIHKSSITDNDFGVQNLLTNTTLNEGTNKTNLYKCDYDITNDIITHDDESDKDDDYKKNFYIRSVETSNVDPNNRTQIGLMGANWASVKGKSLMNLIEYKAKNNNTQNPSNLEYSFTIDAQTIGAIKSYNESHKYDNFNDEYSKGGCQCNNAGNECKCKFIQDLKVSKIGANNYNGINPKYKTDNEIFKYYVTSNKSYDKTDYRNWITKKDYDTLLKSYQSECKKRSGKECTSQEYYEYVWRVVNEGVLP